MSARRPSGVDGMVEAFLLPPRWDGRVVARRRAAVVRGSPDATLGRLLGNRRALWAHSTSWRWAGRRLVLTYLVFLAAPPAPVGRRYVVRPGRLCSRGQADPVRPCAGAAGPGEALRHGLRHVVWLVRQARGAPCLGAIPPALRDRLSAMGDCGAHACPNRGGRCARRSKKLAAWPSRAPAPRARRAP